jgi:DHA1 family inner membrane transport protein
LPGGTAIGNAFGWRVAFVAIAVLAVIAALAVFAALPRQSRGEAEADAPLALQARQLLHQEVFLAYLTIGIAMVGQIAFGTFQVAILTEVTRIDPILAVPVFLLIGGAGAVVGIWTGGRGADWNAGLTAAIAVAGQIVCFALLLLAQHHAVAMAIMLFFSAAFGFAPSSPLQVRILAGAREAPRLAATLVSTAYNIGIAAGAAAGAALLANGAGFSSLPATGIVASTAALVVIVLSIQLSRRGVA